MQYTCNQTCKQYMINCCHVTWLCYFVCIIVYTNHIWILLLVHSSQWRLKTGGFLIKGQVNRIAVTSTVFIAANIVGQSGIPVLCCINCTSSLVVCYSKHSCSTILVSYLTHTFLKFDVSANELMR